MNRFQKITGLVVLLCLCLPGASLFATGGQEKAAEKVTVRWMWLPEATGDVENGPFIAALREKFPNVNFSLEPIPYSAYKEKMPVLMAAGDMPDIFQTNAQAYLPQLVAAGLVANLDEHLAKVGKDVVGNARDGFLAFGQYGGKQYAIPGFYSLKYFAQNIRLDWLENLGLPVPQTMDDFHRVAQAFTNNDPDGNGIKDTYGTSWRKNVNFIDSFFHAYGVAPNHHAAGMWRIRGGKHTNDWVQPEMKEALVNLANWYKEGLVHPESLTWEWNEWWAAYLQNKIGIWYHQPRRLSEMNSALQKAGIKEAKMWPVAPPKGPYGQGTSDEGQPWGTFFGNGKNLAKAVEVFNHTFTQEFYLKAKGETDYAFPTKPELNASGWPVYYTYNEAMQDPGYEERRKLVLYRHIWTGHAIENPNTAKTWPDRALAAHVRQSFLATLGPAQKDGDALADKWAVTSSKTVPVPADAKYFVNIQSMFREVATKIVSGKDPGQAWSDWLAYYNANGGPEIEKEVNELIPVR
jgi:putative aldouronate transport system substrate-binding protein